MNATGICKDVLDAKSEDEVDSPLDPRLPRFPRRIHTILHPILDTPLTWSEEFKSV